jgi:hypothetical protein
MSSVVQSFVKRGVSTSHIWQWFGRPFCGLAMVFLLPVSQSVAATAFCGVEMTLTSVDFTRRVGQGGRVDASSDTAQLKTDDSTLDAEYSSNAELSCRFPQQSSGPAKKIYSGIPAVRKLRNASNVNEGQISDHHQKPVALKMTAFEVGAARTNRCMHKREPCMHESSKSGD